MSGVEAVAWHSTIRACFIVIRPRQWVKSLFVMAPLLFTPDALSIANERAAAVAAAAFAVAASAIYVINDLLDCAADRKHPSKRLRPIAAGLLGGRAALSLAGALLALAAALALAAGRDVAWLVCFYVAVNLLYTLRLKQLPIVDVLTIASGFVARVAAGAAAIAVVPSPWLLECVGLIALFLAIAKRRDDLVLRLTIDHRGSIAGYSALFLDTCMAMVLGCLLALYIVYSASPEVIARLGTDRLYYTVPFVVAGIMRYLQIAIVEQRSGAPTDIVTADRFLIACMAGWLAVFTALVY